MININRYKLIALSIKYQGEYYALYKAILNHEDIDEVYDVNAITILDDEYPKCFLDLKLPPLVLFYKGNIELLNSRCVGVVGSRSICDYAKEATIKLVSKLKFEYTIVSGMAKGVDSIAHKEALDHKTISILGSGIDYIYPYCNKELYLDLIKNHLIISEYPFFTKPLAYHFPFRNRLIAALSDNLYVMQASLKSGTLTTVNEMVELNKDVYALPYEVFDKNGLGTNKLIQEGANLILFDDLGIS